MATELLLLSDVEHLGKAGEVVTVKDGYARNYLLPQDLAAPVTKHALRRLEKLRKEREELAKLQLAEANAKAAQLKDAVITIKAKTVDGIRLYGSVGVAEILAGVKESKNVDLDKTQIDLAEPIREVGEFEITVKLHAKVAPVIKVAVVEE
ncbi:MAG: 50S ribosomal protein L9 [Kiritimatiellae bacterium]|nr:50S ribosomal protein L9 [Kiritimatiellia bacterium]MBR4616066.1 50S ribosomal protein L9 [Kiritimatiellia bacterium]